MDSVATPRLFIGADVELRAEQLAAPLFTRIDGCALTSISRRSKALRPIRRRPFWTFQLQNGRHCGTHFGRKNLLLSQTLDVLIPPRAVQAADDWSASQLCGRQRRQIRRMSCLVRAIYWAVGAKRGDVTPVTAKWKSSIEPFMVGCKRKLRPSEVHGR